MFATLMLVVTLWASDPFPVATRGDPDLRRLHEAWMSEATSPVQRGEMDRRLRAAAAEPAPDWRAVADGYFAWRNSDAAATDLRNATFVYTALRAAAEEAARPPVCVTETRSEPGLWGNYHSTSKTTCDK
jgi:hypothetical protein